MTRRSRFLLLTVASALAVGNVFAQQPAANKPAPADRTIRLDVTVSSRDGKTPPPALQQQDFTLLDNKTPTPLTSFRAVHTGQAPVRVFILIDALNIRLTTLEYERSQVVSFLKARPKLAQRTGIGVLTEKGVQYSPSFTTDGTSLSQWLEQQTLAMRTLRQSTGIYGAEDRYSISIKALQGLAMLQAGPAERTAVLWISPGWPVLSGPGITLDTKQQKAIFANIVQISTLLREQRITLYAINPLGAEESVGRMDYYENFLPGISKYSQVDLGDLSLQVLAMQSGGRAPNSNDTGLLLKQAYDDLESYYILTFEAAPSEKPDVYHHLEVKLSNTGLVAITRDGYYAQP